MLPRIFSFDCRMFRRSILRTVIAFCRRGRASAVCRALMHIRHETVPAAADEIIPVCKPESFSDERPILWNEELHEGALHCFFLGRNGNINRLHCSRVKSRIEHAGGKSAGSGIKILNLLRTLPARLQVFCKCDCKVLPGWLDMKYGTMYWFIPRASLSCLYLRTKRWYSSPPGLPIISST